MAPASGAWWAVVMAEVTIRNMVKRYGSVTAVDDISLHVQDGEFMVFLGPSGCGKTTTLRSIAGLEQPQSGDILIGTRRVNTLSPADRDIAFVFQFYALYPHLNVYDNIAFPLRAQHVVPSEVARRVQSITRILQIEGVLKRRIRQLSSGEQQRVALGRALIRRPQVLLMDEPLTNLDSMLRSETRAELKHLQQEQKVTTVYVTHDQVEAMALGDRITVMHKGRIQQMGTPLDVYRHPSNLFVAGFLGTPPMSLVTGTLQRSNGLLQVAGDGFALNLPDRLTSALQDYANLTKVVIGLRPEAVRLYLKQPPDAAAAQATVYAVEPLGDENIIDVKLGIALLRARTLPSVRPRVGDVVWIAPVAEAIHVFDLHTEQVIGEDTQSPVARTAEPGLSKAGMR
jgi:multiple sugar transport system ATP-binding protein